MGGPARQSEEGSEVVEGGEKGTDKDGSGFRYGKWWLRQWYRQCYCLEVIVG